MRGRRAGRKDAVAAVAAPRGSSRDVYDAAWPATAVSRRRRYVRVTGATASLRVGWHAPPHPHRGRLAVRQRPAPHRSRLRLRRALRRLQPLHADGRQRRAHGQRHRRARHADPGAGRQRGRDRRASSPTATTGSSSRTCTALGLSYDLFTRTTTRNHYAVVQELFTGLLRQRLHRPAKPTLGAISPSTGRTLPDRYIEGTCPICGYDGARGDQCDNCGNQLDPTDLINPRSRINGETPEFVETEHFFLDLPAFAEALGDWLRSRDRLAAQRAEVLPATCSTTSSRARSPATSTGACRSRWTAGGTATTSGSTSGSTRSSATCRRRSSGPGAPATRRPGAQWWHDPRRPPSLLLHGQGQHRLPLGDLAGDPARLRRRG